MLERIICGRLSGILSSMIFGQHIANPIAMIWSGAIMRAIETVLVQGPRTPDMGGTVDTTTVGHAVAAAL